jgi:hypothetical protein
MSPPTAAAGPTSEFLDAVAERLAARRREKSGTGAGLSAPQQPIEAVPPPVLRSGYERAAAVLAWFEPDKIRPLEDAAKPELLDQLLGASVQMSDSEGQRRWTLQSGRRVAILRELRQAGQIGAALAANARPTDPVQDALDSYLVGKPKPIEGQTLGELAATYQVCIWLRSAGFESLPAPHAIERRTNWLRLLQPFEHLAGDDQFRGRVRELQQLRSYAGVLPPGSLLESVHRAFEETFGSSEKPPLLITGPGGVGKSTLLSRFILEHARALEVERFPFVYLDFDRPEVDAGEPLTLLIEAARQLAVEYPLAREAWDKLRGLWVEAISRSRQEIARQSASVKSAASATSTLGAAIRDFSALVFTLGASDLPVLFVLDTFEEVQWQSAGHVAAIWTLLEEMQATLPRLRVVLAGRADVEGRRTETLALTGLDEESAVAYLQARGIGDEAVARRVARQIGGSPLSLKLAVELAQREGLDKRGRLAVATHDFFFLRLDSALLQRQLYKRVLTHVHDEKVRQLAHPGLVLRRITPDLILKVLAEPCGIEVASLADAEELFEKLKREVALVTVAPDGSVRHRQDLRIVMLELLRADDSDKVRNIHERAAAYYEGRPPVVAERAEEIYHRLQLDQEPAVIDPRWMEGVERYLGNAMEEFSGRRRAYLASRLGVDVDEATRSLADLQDWEKITAQRVVLLLAQDGTARAIDLMRSRSERSSASPLVALECRALSRVGRWQEALAVLDAGFERAVTDGARAEAFALALQAAEVVLYSRQVGQASPAYERLVGISGEAASALQQLEGAIRRLALVKLDPALAGKDGELRGKFETLFDGLRDDQLTAQPGLGHWAASIFERGDARRLARVITLAGLPRSSESELRQLGAELTAFDAAISKDFAMPPGVLAGELGISIPAKASLTAAWSDYLISSADSVIQSGLASLLNDHADFVPPRVIEAFANVMLVSLGIRLTVVAESTPPRAEPTGKTAKPPGKEIQRLSDALADAFSYAELAEFVRSRLDRNIESIVPLGQPLQSIMRTLVTFAQKEGWLSDLIAQAYYEKPGNSELAALAREFGITGFASESTLQTIFQESKAFTDVASFTAGLDQVAATICRIEIGERVMATGFLVGVDLLLTADFVLSEVLSGSVSSAQVACRFDYREAQDGNLATTGTVFRLAEDWLVARDPYVSLSAGLGYALLRVAGSPGAQPVGGGRGTSRRLRQWLTLSPKAPRPEPQDSLFIMMHAQGGPLKFSTGPVLDVAADGTRLRYLNDTAPGSSGAPCLSRDFELVGMHLGTNPDSGSRPKEAWGFGVPVAAIAADLERKGLGGATQVAFA